MRLIDADDVLAYIERVYSSGLGKGKALKYISKYIDNTQTVEAVPTSTIQRAIDNIGCVARSTTNADFINGCTASLIELDRALKTNCGADMRGEKND